MPYIIGTSINLGGLHEVTNKRTVSNKEFFAELTAAIESIHDKKDKNFESSVKNFTELAHMGLCSIRSVHIAGKYFFSGKR